MQDKRSGLTFLLAAAVVLSGCAGEPTAAERWDLPIDEAATAPALSHVEYLGSTAVVSVSTGRDAAGWVVYASSAEGSSIMEDWPDDWSVFAGQEQPLREATVSLTEGLVEVRAHALTLDERLSRATVLTIDPDAEENECGYAFEEASREAALGNGEESALVATLRSCEREQWKRTATHLPAALGRTSITYTDAHSFLDMLCRGYPRVGLC